jgi:drug/metabolite transporter (DMT)-like permease
VTVHRDARDLEGMLYALVGIVAFSLSLVATRVAVPDMGGVFVGLGRALVAATLAGLVLLARGERFPGRQFVAPLLIVGVGVVAGFPIFTSLALQTVPAIHGVVIVGLLPAFTAVFAVTRGRERVTPLFWGAVALGVIGILVFAFTEGAGALRLEDAYLLAAVILGALGYAEGGRLSRDLGGWRVICWALVLSAPFLILPVLLNLPENFSRVSGVAWLGFAYVSAVSMFLGFFAWYHGMALAGIARSSQLQLLQPMLSVAWAALLLGERISWQTVIALVIVIGSVALSRLARAQPPREPDARERQV